MVYTHPDFMTIDGTKGKSYYKLWMVCCLGTLQELVATFCDLPLRYAGIFVKAKISRSDTENLYRHESSSAC